MNRVDRRITIDVSGRMGRSPDLQRRWLRELAMTTEHHPADGSSTHGSTHSVHDTAPTGGQGGVRLDRSRSVVPTEGVGTAGGPGSIISQSPAGSQSTGALDLTGDWPYWAAVQLHEAVRVAGHAASVGGGRGLAGELYRYWYSVQSPPVAVRALAGLYRRAHAATGSHLDIDGELVLDRYDHVGDDGWWRTWNGRWARRHRSALDRVLFSPDPDRLADFVHALTGALETIAEPWLLACPTDPAQVGRAGAAVLFLPTGSVSSPQLAGLVGHCLRDAAPPLCLELAPGVAWAQDPGNGMSFGEHRCHLIALALQLGRPDPLAAIAHVFASHGIDPARPYLSGLPLVER
jgi:HopA1 effector protein family